MNATNTTTSRAHEALRRYLELKDFEVVEDGWAHGQDSIDFIARDSGDLVFVATSTAANAGEGFPEEPFDRKAFERLAAAYLAETDVAGCNVRLDAVSLLVVGESRALLKHYVNALSEVG